MNDVEREYRAVVKYLLLKGLSVDETHAEMQQVLGDDCPPLGTITRWANEFTSSAKLKSKKN